MTMKQRDVEPVEVDDHGKVTGDAGLWQVMLADITPEEEMEQRMNSAVYLCRECGVSLDVAYRMYGPFDGLDSYKELQRRLTKGA